MEEHLPGIPLVPYKYFSVNIYFNEFTYSFLMQESPLLNSSQTHYIQTTHGKCTKILFNVSSSTRVLELGSLQCLFL